jgi:hypothetical protein
LLDRKEKCYGKDGNWYKQNNSNNRGYFQHDLPPDWLLLFKLVDQQVTINVVMFTALKRQKATKLDK